MQQNPNNLLSNAIEKVQSLTAEVLHYNNIDLEDRFPNYLKFCNSTCAQLLYDFLVSPLKNHNKFQIDISELKSLHNITNDYDKFYYYMLNVLVSEKLVSIDGSLLVFKKNINSSHSISELKIKYPMFQGTINLLEHCASHYELALSGRIPAISVLYPDGDVTFLDEILSKDTAEYTEMPIIRDIGVNLISHLSNIKPLRILEIGGGRGIIMRELLNSINTNNIIQYHFTDISKRFVIDMNRYAKSNNLNFLKCSQFDITKSPENQEIELNAYDIIIGLDVVHATPDIERTLKILKSLINQDGILCLLETTHAVRIQNLIMGLTKGWWLFNDLWRKSTPLLSSSHWAEVIVKCGYTLPHTVTLKNINSDAALIITTQLSM